jgi:hypothetical protein
MEVIRSSETAILIRVTRLKSQKTAFFLCKIIGITDGILGVSNQSTMSTTVDNIKPTVLVSIFDRRKHLDHTSGLEFTSWFNWTFSVLKLLQKTLDLIFSHRRMSVASSGMWPGVNIIYFHSIFWNKILFKTVLCLLFFLYSFTVKMEAIYFSWNFVDFHRTAPLHI